MGLRHYELTDPVLWRIAELIHEADLDDDQTLTYTTPIFDGLYEYHRRAMLLGHEPATTTIASAPS